MCFAVHNKKEEYYIQNSLLILYRLTQSKKKIHTIPPPLHDNSAIIVFESDLLIA